MRRYLAPMIFMLVLTGCASSQPFLVSGEAINVLGQQFVATSVTMNALYTNKTVNDEQYKAWASFGKTFKLVYPQLVTGWKAAVTANDQAKQQQIAATITTLAGTLGQFIETAIALQHKQ